MKNVNPIGREPSEEKLSAYGCVCNIPTGNSSTVSGNVPCNVCAFSCADGNIANRNKNESESTSRMTHTG